MEIRRSAAKHGIAESDMLHAVRNPIRIVELDENKALVIGASTAGTLLEIVVVDSDTDTARIIHAMPLRRNFYQYLSKG